MQEKGLKKPKFQFQQVNKKEKKLFLKETLFFRVVFAFVYAELALGFDAAAFACVFAP